MRWWRKRTPQVSDVDYRQLAETLRDRRKTRDVSAVRQEPRVTTPPPRGTDVKRAVGNLVTVWSTTPKTWDPEPGKPEEAWCASAFLLYTVIICAIVSSLTILTVLVANRTMSLPVVFGIAMCIIPAVGAIVLVRAIARKSRL
jgi:hypothetical protein